MNESDCSATRHGDNRLRRRPLTLDLIRRPVEADRFTVDGLDEVDRNETVQAARADVLLSELDLTLRFCEAVPIATIDDTRKWQARPKPARSTNIMSETRHFWYEYPTADTRSLGVSG